MRRNLVNDRNRRRPYPNNRPAPRRNLRPPRVLHEIISHPPLLTQPLDLLELLLDSLVRQLQTNLGAASYLPSPA